MWLRCYGLKGRATLRADSKRVRIVAAVHLLKTVRSSACDPGELPEEINVAKVVELIVSNRPASPRLRCGWQNNHLVYISS